MKLTMVRLRRPLVMALLAVGLSWSLSVTLAGDQAATKHAPHRGCAGSTTPQAVTQWLAAFQGAARTAEASRSAAARRARVAGRRSGDASAFTLRPPAGSGSAPTASPITAASASTALPEFSSITAGGTLRPSVAMRVLVLSSDGNEVSLPAITESLQYLGVPYDVWVATAHPGEWQGGVLRAGTTGKYAGIILADGELGYTPPGGVFQSAFTAADWDVLAAYETAFSVREVAWYSFPTSTYGFTAAEVVGAGPLDVTLTAMGQTIFPYLNPATPIALENTWIYRGSLLGAGTALLQDSGGKVLAIHYPQAGGRESVALTFDSSQWTRHHKLFAFGLINWVTKGLFLGQRRVFAQAQADDAYIDDDQYGGDVYRMTGDDVTASITWMHAWQTLPQFAAFKFQMAFNGFGTGGYGYNPDTLTPAFRANEAEFYWVNHTYDHELLNNVTYAFGLAELVDNHAVALAEGYTHYDIRNLVTPEISGLTNAEFMRAAKDFGIRYLVSDTSRPEGRNPSPNAGKYNPLEPLILEIPRYPTNIFYNTTTPTEQTDYYNELYSAFWGRNLTYAEIIDYESDLLVDHMLQGDTNPWMFHVANVRAYDGVHSLLSDTMDAVFTKFGAFTTLTVLNPPMQDVGQIVADRMVYNAAKIGSWRVGNDYLVLIADRAVTVPVTGLTHASSIAYGGQDIAFVALTPYEAQVLPLAGATSSLTLALSSPAVAENGGVAAATLTLTRNVADVSQPLTVALATSDSALVVPATVDIPAGETSVTVNLGTVDDALANGDRWALLVADGEAVGVAAAVVTVDDDEGRSLTVAVAPTYVAENGGASTATGTVTLNQTATHDVVVTLSSNLPGRTALPASVLVPRGATTANFTLGAQDDALANGDELATLTAAAPAYGSGDTAVTIEDDEGRLLTLTLQPDVVLESAGVFAGNGVVMLNAAVARDQVVSLTNPEPGRVTCPATVTVPAGQMLAVFSFGTVDNALADGDVQLTITAQSPPYTAGADTLIVDDDEGRTLTLGFAPAYVVENAGANASTGTLTLDHALLHALVVNLSGASGTRLVLPASVTVPAGQASATFAVGVTNNSLTDGDLTRTITAAATGFPNATAGLLVEDDEGRVLTLTVSPTVVLEGDGANAATGTVAVNRTLTHDQSVALTNPAATRLTVPATVTVPAGQTSVTFAVGAVENQTLDGNATLALTAASAGFANASASLYVRDNDGGSRVVNGDIEQGTLTGGGGDGGDSAAYATGWTTYGTAIGTWDDAAARSGFHSLRVSGTGGDGGFFGEQFALPEPWPYALTFCGWVRTQNVAAAATVALKFLVTFADGSTTWTTLTAATGTHDWQQARRTQTFSQRVWRVRPYAVLTGGSGVQQCWFDDLAVVPHDTIALNLSAEDGTAGVGPSDWFTAYQSLTRVTGWATDEAHSGTRSLKIAKSDAALALWYGTELALPQPGPLELTFRGWSKAQNVAAATNYGLTFRVVLDDASVLWCATGMFFTSGTHDWEQKSYTTSFARRVVSVRPYAVFYGGSGNQTAWFDDLEVVPSDNSAYNAGAENGSSAPENWSTFYQSLTNQTGWATDQVHGGSRALKIAKSSATNAMWRGQARDFTGQLPHAVTFRGWSLADTVSAAATSYSLTYAVTLEDNSTTWLTLPFATGAAGWQKLERLVCFSPRVKSITPYALLYGGSGTQTAWFDDLTMIPSLAAIYNPQMELADSAGLPDGWVTSGQSLTTATGWATDAARSGTRALKISKSSGTNAVWRGRDVPFSGTLPKTFTFRGWSKADAVAGSSLYALDFYVQFEDNSEQHYASGLSFATGTHDWEKVERQITFAKGVKLLRPWALFYGGTGSAWFDDVEAIPSY